jgi:transposase
MVVDGQNIGIEACLRERGRWKANWNARCKKCPPERLQPNHDCCAATFLSWQPDFRAQKCAVAEVIEEYNKRHGTRHEVEFLPKFHCELNPIERVWAALKLYLRKLQPGTAAKLRAAVPQAMSAGINHDAWGRYFRKSFRIASAYRRGCSFALAEFAARKFKSHRAIPSDTTVDRILQELSQASPKVFERVTRSMQMADARKSDAIPEPAVALPQEVADDSVAVWEGVVEDREGDGDDVMSEAEDASVDAASDEPSRRIQDGLVVLPVEKNTVAKPANVGPSFEGAVFEEAKALQRADGGRVMRKRSHVNSN